MQALVVGAFGQDHLRPIQSALARAEVSVKYCSDTSQLGAELKLRPPPALIVVDGETVDLDAFAAEVRGDARLFGSLLVAVLPSMSETTYVKAYEAGVDDVVSSSEVGALTRRIRRIGDWDPQARPDADQGRVLIAHTRPDRRRVLGRTLRMAGFDVTFAASPNEIVAPGPGPGLKLAVVEESVAPAVTDKLRAEDAQLPIIVLSREVIGEPIRGRVGLARMDGPPDQLLFLANELFRAGGDNQRSSARRLFSGMCAFRPAGTLRRVLGLTYNISREGLFIRTLEPPAAGTRLWLELKPPSRQELVHLRAETVWVRPPNRLGGTTPPGFAVRLSEAECPPADLERYRESYDGLIDEAKMVA